MTFLQSGQSKLVRMVFSDDWIESVAFRLSTVNMCWYSYDDVVDDVDVDDVVDRDFVSGDVSGDVCGDGGIDGKGMGTFPLFLFLRLMALIVYTMIYNDIRLYIQ
jgi:hypothetical protein